MAAILNLREVRHPRHPGVSPAVSDAFAEAAEVCLDRYHSPPETVVEVHWQDNLLLSTLLWSAPTVVAQRAWHNRDDATRDGAYIVSLAVIDAYLGFVAISRAETRTGADYYVARPEAEDLENAFRVEFLALMPVTIERFGSACERKVGKRLAAGRIFLPWPV
jgi:hypothetical protein